MHIMWNIDKGKMLTASRRIDKCPTPGQRFSDKFPTAGTDKMRNTQQMPQLQQNLIKFINETASTRRWHLNPSTLIDYPPLLDENLWKRCEKYVKYPVTSKHPVKNPVNLA